jgi:hypothetical protein
MKFQYRHMNLCAERPSEIKGFASSAACSSTPQQNF